eukprot:NODE_2348_length_952_cov_317.148272.p2 GENE.NODE_2348_length_952_cov_317.148272~~NODE_2348_length_952_cov_317.148272.p2  ORF type:complete len:156 (+),score=38.81 NODE_2348_length_952_cov_317.148272:3-470(+)
MGYSSGGIREYDEAAALLTLEVATAPAVAGSSSRDKQAIDNARLGITEHIVVSRTGAAPYVRHLLLLLTPTLLLLAQLDAQHIAIRWALPLAGLRSVRASSSGVAVFAQAASTRRVSVVAVTHQIPCGEPRVIKVIYKLLRPLCVGQGLPPLPGI